MKTTGYETVHTQQLLDKYIYATTIENEHDRELRKQLIKSEILKRVNKMFRLMDNGEVIDDKIAMRIFQEGF